MRQSRPFATHIESSYQAFMISLRDVTLARGAKRLFEGASLALFPGQRIGVVGPNGSGKSSFFAMLLGQLHPDRGDLDIPAAFAVEHVAQETPGVAQAAIEYVLDGDLELRLAEREMTEAEAAHGDDADSTAAGERIAHAHERYTELGGWEARSRAATLLAGLGVQSSDHDRAVAELSGGMRMRLNLARALMRRSDVLLLDEPTNHLDLDAVFWLEEWLVGYKGTLFLVSHDREFLDATANNILHFDHGKLRLYRGTYTQFEIQLSSALEQQQSVHDAQTRRVAELQQFIDRFRAKATKARQAQSRLKALERMELIAPAHVDSPFRFRFREFPGSPDPVLALDNISVGYGNTPVLTGIKLEIRNGARLGILGRNGAGKSTLVKMLAGMLPELSGTRVDGRNLRIGYFAQHQVDAIDSEASPLLQIQRRDRNAREQVLRDFLGGFGFVGDMALEPARDFSGGERARLALALLVWDRPNLLLLDEPTNHLDIDMREALAEALQEYEGALILVSHDRHLLRTCADELCLVRNGQVEAFEGDLDDYRDTLARDKSGRNSTSGASRKDERKREAAERQSRANERKPLGKKLERLEVELKKLHDAQKIIASKLADDAFYSGAPASEVALALKEQTRLAREVERCESEWLELTETLEKLDSDARIN